MTSVCLDLDDKLQDIGKFPRICRILDLSFPGGFVVLVSNGRERGLQKN